MEDRFPGDLPAGVGCPALLAVAAVFDACSARLSRFCHRGNTEDVSSLCNEPSPSLISKPVFKYDMSAQRAHAVQ